MGDPAPATTEPAAAGARPRRVMIVDDSSTFRLQLRGLLEGQGLEVVEAANGFDGLAALEQNQMDLLIIDVNMPVMNGLEMITHIRKLPEYQKTPIFLLTTESSGDSVRQGKAVGATAWVVKPFKNDVLIGAIKRVLQL